MDKPNRKQANQNKDRWCYSTGKKDLQFCISFLFYWIIYCEKKKINYYSFKERTIFYHSISDHYNKVVNHQ